VCVQASEFIFNFAKLTWKHHKAFCSHFTAELL